MIRANLNTPICIYVKESKYVSGEGADTKWIKVTTDLTDVFYCEWSSMQGILRKYGEKVMTAHAEGVNDMVSVRMVYIPEVYTALKNNKAVIVKNLDETAVNKNPDKNNPNVFELYSGIGNIGEENQFMEFALKRYQGK